MKIASWRGCPEKLSAHMAECSIGSKVFLFIPFYYFQLQGILGEVPYIWLSSNLMPNAICKSVCVWSNS